MSGCGQGGGFAPSMPGKEPERRRHEMTTTRATSDTDTRAPTDLDGRPADVDGRSGWAERHMADGRTVRTDRGGTAAAGVAAATRGLTRLIRLAAGILAAIIVLGILFIVLE